MEDGSTITSSQFTLISLNVGQCLIDFSQFCLQCIKLMGRLNRTFTISIGIISPCNSSRILIRSNSNTIVFCIQRYMVTISYLSVDDTSQHTSEQLLNLVILCKILSRHTLTQLKIGFSDILTGIGTCSTG